MMFYDLHCRKEILERISDLQHSQTFSPSYLQGPGEHSTSASLPPPANISIQPGPSTVVLNRQPPGMYPFKFEFE